MKNLKLKIEERITNLEKKVNAIRLGVSVVHIVNSEIIKELKWVLELIENEENCN